MIAASLLLAMVMNGVLAGYPALPDTAGVREALTPAHGEVASHTNPQQPRFDPSRFDTATASGLRDLLDSAAANKVPPGPLINLALRGLAMHASGTKIVSLVRVHYKAMLDARAALGDDATESELDSGADAIKLGVDGKALQAVRTTRPVAGSAVTSLVVLTDLVRRGISTGRARDAVTALGRASRSDDAINGLQAMVAKNAERGPGMAQDALDRYVKTNISGVQKNVPPKQVSRPPSP